MMFSSSTTVFTMSLFPALCKPRTFADFTTSQRTWPGGSIWTTFDPADGWSAVAFPTDTDFNSSACILPCVTTDDTTTISYRFCRPVRSDKDRRAKKPCPLEQETDVVTPINDALNAFHTHRRHVSSMDHNVTWRWYRTTVVQHQADRPVENKRRRTPQLLSLSSFGDGIVME